MLLAQQAASAATSHPAPGAAAAKTARVLRTARAGSRRQWALLTTPTRISTCRRTTTAR